MKLNSYSYVIGPGVNYEVHNWLGESDAFENGDQYWPLAPPTSSSGICVTEDKAMTLGLVFQALSMISADVARMPVHVYMRKDDGSRAVDELHPADGLICRLANSMLHAKQFWRWMMVQSLMYNSAYAYIARDGMGRPRALYPLLSDRTCVDTADGQRVFVTEMWDGETPDLLTLYPSQVLHLQGIHLGYDFDNTRRNQFLQYARDAFGLALAQRNYKSHYFQRGGRVGGILQLPDGMSKTAQDRVEAGFKKTYQTVEAAFQTVVLRDGVTFSASQMSPEESQMTEADADVGREVARWFNLAPSRLGVPESQSYGSKVEDNRAYYDQTLAPWTEVVIGPECELKLLEPKEFTSGRCYIKHDTRQLLSMNQAERFQMYETGRMIGVLSPNEIRIAEDMPKRDDPGGDSYDNPNTTPGGPAATTENVEAHRRLFERTLEGTLRVVAERAGKAAKSPQALKTHADGKLLVNLRKPAQEAGQVADLYDARGWELWIYSELVGRLQPALENIEAGDVSASVAEAFEKAITLGVNEISNRIYGTCKST